MEIAITVSVDDIYFLLSELNDFAILPMWGSRAVVVSSKERAMTVGAFSLMSIVDSSCNGTYRMLFN